MPITIAVGITAGLAVIVHLYWLGRVRNARRGAIIAKRKEAGWAANFLLRGVLLRLFKGLLFLVAVMGILLGQGSHGPTLFGYHHGLALLGYLLAFIPLVDMLTSLLDLRDLS